MVLNNTVGRVWKPLIVLIFIWSPVNSWTQVDSTYIKAFEFQYAARGYVAKNALSLIIDHKDETETIFAPNNPVNLGLGFSWKNSSLSFGYGFSSMRDREKGTTKTLDLQYHHYGEHWILDLYALRNRGFYEETGGVIDLYPDLQSSLYGIFSQYVFSGDKFSFGAAFDQNKIQVKSAGSWLIGGNVYYTRVKKLPPIDDIEVGGDTWNLQLGPNGGYAYSWVFLPNFYLAGSLSIGINVGFEDEQGIDQRKFLVNPLLFGRISVGYNGPDWTVNISALNNKVYVKFGDEYQTSLGSNQFKLTFVKRFDLKKEIPFLKSDLRFPRLRSKDISDKTSSYNR
ncbi:DUF4421 family protein [Flavobacterium sp. JP2137]|uniref:DUF4421 family protein n=1 Tax=Flavobacterium sp. JP2137 TaxID=3414510 RepID=UPI003D2FC471